MRPHDHCEAIGLFRTSSFSGGGNCVEVARLPDGCAVVRDSKDRRRRVRLAFGRSTWAAFVTDVRLRASGD